jgi:hypothetical protein
MMNRIMIITTRAIILFICMGFIPANGQTPEPHDGSYALPENLVQRPESFLGFPNENEKNLLEKFREPPHGYGEVPFYWWTGGDTLTKERLLWQLNKLSETEVLGLNVSYNHTHILADPELNEGKKTPFGVAESSYPNFMSEAWWDLWNWFSEECGKRDMGLGLDDYVLGFPGAGYWTDVVESHLLEKNYQGKLKLHETISLSKGEEIEIKVTEPLISIIAYPKENGSYHHDERMDLSEAVHESVLKWNAPDQRPWDIIMISSEKGFMIHPDHGNQLVEAYYQRFEDRLSPDGKKGMNFFFQDELHVPIDNFVWSEDFEVLFRNKKGYDIKNFLPALYYDIGDITPKIRLDYYDVMVELAEKRYFKPVFEWHWQRGKLIGCDNWGRGLNPLRYGDYFRATRWFSAPGNDAPNPASGYSFIQTKVSSSVAHLYKRPRVWLEAYHSLGWDATLSQIDFSTYKHFQFGANMLCLHGLYYTTHGGWWEWAPPDFHFRMPYWPHFKEWLKGAERLSYILSQGVHVCDIAILYPVAPLQARNGGAQQVSFRTGEMLFNNGLDFDFIDYQSLNRASISDGAINVSDESYRVLVLADMTAIRYSTLQKTLEHFNKGGVVVGVERLPVASDRAGANDPELDGILKKIFGFTASEAAQLDSPTIHNNRGTGIYFPSADERLADLISEHIDRDFTPEGGKGTVMHRKIGNNNLYLVMDMPDNSLCHFRTSGKPYLLDPETGNHRELKIVNSTELVTSLRLPAGIEGSNLILFVPGKADKETEVHKDNLYQERVISGKWESEFVPTMDNRWGDFRFPAKEDTIGVEARFFMYKMSDKPNDELINEELGKNWDKITYSFGPGYWLIHTSDREGEEMLEEIISDRQVLKSGEKTYTWLPYHYSLRTGVEGNPGSQGYHGLKGKVTDDFLILEESGTYFFKTYLHSEKRKKVDIHISGHLPDAVYLNGKITDGKTAMLSRGINHLVVYYRNIPPTTINRNTRHPIDLRTRSAVVLFDEDSRFIARKPVAMKWFGQKGMNTFDVYKGEQKYGYYRFIAPPGLRKIECRVFGEINAWLGGKALRVEKTSKESDEGLSEYTIYLDGNGHDDAEVCIGVKHFPGYYYGKAFPEPVKLFCGYGTIETGDWAQKGVLNSYSGGLWYRKQIKLTREEISENIFLDLGDVVATAEVHINGKKAGICLKKPFRLNIKDFVNEGDNYFEILVYSTLANHYLTIPTPRDYKRSYAAGLLGPVKICFETTHAPGHCLKNEN